MKITPFQLAKICHEANRAYCWSLGDPSQPAWDMAPDWQIKSAVEGVMYHLLEPNATPADSHQQWLALKLQDGWTYGPVKDPFIKTHPCIMHYSYLPEDQKAKDALFMGIVNALRNQVEMKYGKDEDRSYRYQPE